MELFSILVSTIVFLFVILFLISILLYAKSKLVPSGKVQITINNERKILVSAGNTILTNLSNSKLFLPSACGGGGTCGMCKCQVFSGGGEILPTETPFFSRSQIGNNWRLGCQVKVKQNMEIKIPDEVFGIKKWECEVVSNKNVATYIKEFVVKLPKGETLDFKSGGYIQIDVPPYKLDFRRDLYNITDKFKSDYENFNIFDLKAKNSETIFRAYSMANHPAEGNIIKLNIRLATPPFDKHKKGFMSVNPGVCSSYVFTRKPGDRITISGPFGDFFIKPTQKEMVYIGGGAGMAPLRSHIFHLFHTLETDRKVSYWYGGRSTKELFYTEEFRNIEKKFTNFKYHIALSEPLPEDKWEGFQGFIHQVLLNNYLNKHPEPDEIEYYLCGPPLMLQASLKMLDDLGVPEENIAFDDFG